MNTSTVVTDYPESDGKPMADNTLQFEWLVTIKGGLEAVFRHDPNVFVAGDLLWYPVEGKNTICLAPDVMVVIGRPKGYRGSYRQWEEDGIPPQVVFEILSPGNRTGEMDRKLEFYERYGVEEYYLFDPEQQRLKGWLRAEDELQKIPSLVDWRSPLLKFRFDFQDNDVHILGPDGSPFATYLELIEQHEKEKQAKELAQQREELERLEKELAQQHANRLAAQLRALGIEPAD